MLIVGGMLSNIPVIKTVGQGLDLQWSGALRYKTILPNRFDTDLSMIRYVGLINLIESEAVIFCSGFLIKKYLHLRTCFLI